jgi:hypothetical protein
MHKRPVRTGARRREMTTAEALRDYADRLLAVQPPKMNDPLGKHAMKRARKYLSDFATDMRVNFK